jgi:UDP-N-acetylglucosamine transferase subunit ALG13
MAPPTPVTVVVSVGTDHHRFDRLVTWASRWASTRPEVSLVVQAGSTPVPAGVDGRSIVAHDELLALFRDAVAVVVHGGPGSVMDVRRSGLVPLVVARDPARSEHVDDHQLRFSAHLARHELAVVVDDEAALVRELDAVLADPERLRLPAGAVLDAPGVGRFAAVLDELLGLAPTSRLPTADAPTVQGPARVA